MRDDAIMQGSERRHADDPFSKALCWAQIDNIADGVVSGTSSALDQIFLIVNGRAIGAVLVVRPALASETSDVKPGSWRFDARQLPPPLLLDDTLTFDIQAGRSSALVFDTREIETSSLFSAAGRPQRRGALEGYIDGIDGDVIRGWVWDPTNVTRRIRVLLFVGGVFRGLFEASRMRPDLEATGRGDGHYGFAIPSREVLAKAGVPRPHIRIVACEPEFWDVPFAPHTQAPSRRWPRLPRAPSLPRWHQGPASPHALVAILTGTESFPKKIYAIDQVTQRMPDAFTADYVCLALEFLRIEMVKEAGAPAAGWHKRIIGWSRQRIVRRQIRRLAALAEAIAATQTLLRAQNPGGLDQPSPAASVRHAPA